MTRLIKRKLLLIATVTVLILFLFGIVLFFYFKGYSIKNSESGFGVWRTYKNNGKYNYQVGYPISWKANPLVTLIDDESVGLGPNDKSGDGLRVVCPMDAFDRKELPDPETVYVTDYTDIPECISNMTINGTKTIQWIMGDQVNTYFLRNGNPLVCNLWSNLKPNTLDKKNCSETIKAQKTYNLILSSFKFTN